MDPYLIRCAAPRRNPGRPAALFAWPSGHRSWCATPMGPISGGTGAVTGPPSPRQRHRGGQFGAHAALSYTECPSSQ
jgi:hypothetical protein